MSSQETHPTAETELAVDGLHFAECLRWHDGLLYLCDMCGDRVHSFDPDTGELRTITEVFHPAGIGWLPDGRMLVVASEDRVILEIGESGNRIYADLADVVPGWLSDMLVHPSGGIYAGNFGYALFSEDPRSTHLALVGRDGSIALQSDESCSRMG
jgi:sugar lactone lactonase YvrE